MVVSAYLAMTAAELHAAQALPPKLAYMACHFSPYGLGLSNRPESLPPESLLIVNDRTPICGHDPGCITAQLAELIHRLNCSGVLLDFQRPGCEETAALCRSVAGELSCPVAVSDVYAGELDCPVFLPPAPLHMPLRDHLSPWLDREIWLEAALDALCITVTERGSNFSPTSYTPPPENCHTDETLHCRYFQEVSPEAIKFYLYRPEDQMEALLKEGESLGVAKAVGLYQQLGKYL